MPILKIRKGFTLTHGQSVFTAGDVIECSDQFARGVAHMTEPAKEADAAKRAKLIRDAEPADARRLSRPPAAA